MTTARILVLGTISLLGASCATSRLPKQAAELSPETLFWAGAVVVIPESSEGPSVMVFPLSVPQEMVPGRTTIDPARLFVAVGRKHSGYWVFSPPENPAVSELRLYPDGRVYGIRPVASDCQALFRVEPALVPGSRDRIIGVRLNGRLGILHLVPSMVLEHFEGKCPNRPAPLPPSHAESLPA